MSLDPTLPIKLDSTSNGEYAPWPVGRTVTHAKQLAAERIATHAGRTGQSRRVFLTGLCGAATTLLAFNDAFAWRGHRGGSFELPREAAFEPAAALAAVGGREFIFDIQTHMVEADGAWRRERPQGMNWLAQTPQGRCGETDPLRCFDAPHFIKEVFLDSDTDMAVLSFVPELPERNPLSLQEAARVRELVKALGPGRRLLLHAMIVPNAEPLAAPIYGVDPAQARRRAAGDPVDHLRASYREDPHPSFRTYGPRDLGEWRRFRAVHGVGPA